MISPILPKTDHVYKEAKDFIENLLAERRTSLDEMIRAGRLEHALFMLVVKARNILYRDMVPHAETEFLRTYLSERGLSTSKIREGTTVELTVRELDELVRRTRKWSWSLRQTIIPIRGKVLEKVVSLIVGDSLLEAFGELSRVKVVGRDTSGDKKFHNMDFTVFFSSGRKTVTVGFTIKGNIRERKDESVDTRRRALKSGTHDQVWHVFLSEGDPQDIAALTQIDPAEDGEVYTWAGIAELVKKPGIKSISLLPSEVVSYAKSKQPG